MYTQGAKGVSIVGRLSTLESVHYQRFHCVPGQTEKVMKLVGSHARVCLPHGHEILLYCLRAKWGKFGTTQTKLVGT